MHNQYFTFLKPLALTLSLGAISFTQVGCSYLAPYKAGVTQGTILTQESVDLLQNGLTKDQVRQLIGPEMGENPFNTNHWEYVYFSTADGKDLSEVKKHLIIDFDQDGLVSNIQSKPLNIQLKKEEKFLGLF